ncbi:MAG: D-alanyl-D-alanine dipeptidase [Candidatus Omnitrophica bacterium]|nr:D-alanyl-D-alanine dipeptidase [Candidatus Omnitrophota bacterium]
MRRLERWIITGISLVFLTSIFLYVRTGEEKSAGEEAQVASETRTQFPLVEVKEVIPDIILDIRYATADNFTGKVLYPSADCFLLEEAALALKAVQDDLKEQGFRLKIYDGYRPFSVQKKMWEVMPNPNYVADPQKGSMHNRGCAVDVGLADMEGRDVEMPTEFDNFTEKAHRDYQHLTADAIAHRRILKEAMERRGFASIRTEWWHFSFKASQNKPVLNIPFEAVKSVVPGRN